MGRQTGKRIAAGMLCLLLFLIAGCSGEKEENKAQGEEQEEIRTEALSEEQETETTEKKQLKQTDRPRFIPNGIRSVSLQKDGDVFLHISREPAEYKMSFDYWEIVHPYDENVTMNTEAMFQMFEALCSLTFDTPAQIGEGTDTGIRDSRTSFRVEYVDTRDDTVARNTEDADTVIEILIGREDENGGRYAAAAGKEEDVYVLPEAILRMVYDPVPFDYILKIPVLISADTLKNIEITTGGGQYEIQVDTAGDSYQFGKKKVEKEEFASLYQAISGIMLVSEIDGEGRGGEEEPELTVIFHRNTKEAPDVRVAYYPYDPEYDSVEINGREWFLVRKEDVKALVEQFQKIF